MRPMMKNKIRRLFRIMPAMILMMGLCSMSIAVYAADWTVSYTSDSTGYQVVLEDRQNLFDDSGETEIIEEAKQITNYANILVLTDSTDYYQTNAENSLIEAFGSSEDSVIFYIDMNPGDRHIYIYSLNGAYKLLTSGKAYTITDTTYKYASRGEYEECAIASLEQICTVLQNGHIPQPMKWIGCLMIALALSSVIMFFILQRVIGKNDEIELQPLHNLRTNGTEINYIITHTDRHYSPRSSGSSGGGGGGGGGSSGGGGGHSF